jgi:hypothetical protein
MGSHPKIQKNDVLVEKRHQNPEIFSNSPDEESLQGSDLHPSTAKDRELQRLAKDIQRNIPHKRDKIFDKVRDSHSCTQLFRVAKDIDRQIYRKTEH